MSILLHPTPYADVNAALDDLAVSIRAALGNRMSGMYLSGSLALGDFDPLSSDIDTVVVTDAEVGDDLFVALKGVHARFGAGGSPWAERVEVVYVPRCALRYAAPSAASYPQLERGGTLFRDVLESGWAIQRHILREHGVVVAGPVPRTLIPAVDPLDMCRASVGIATAWREQARQDPAWLDWLRNGEAQAFVVQTLCRLLYTLDSGSVASKPGATRWAQKALGKRWAALIERSLARRHDGRGTPESDVDETVALIQFTIERSQQ